MKPIPRQAHLRNLSRLLRENPVVALLGARQVGKTTLARELMRERRGPTTWFDLEHPRDLRQLDEPTLTLEPLRGLVMLDEIQNRPQLFPILRVLADRSPRPARFLVLGSASPELLRQGSETLAGRIAFYELPASILRRWSLPTGNASGCAADFRAPTCRDRTARAPSGARTSCARSSSGTCHAWAPSSLRTPFRTSGP